MISWLLALLASSQVAYELLALVFIPKQKEWNAPFIGLPKRTLFSYAPFSELTKLNAKKKSQGRRFI